MKRFSAVAARDDRLFAIADRLGRLAERIADAFRSAPRPEGYEEFDPRKRGETDIRSVTPSHLHGAGGQPTFFRLPRE